VILRNCLRRDGYNPQVDANNDALQAIRVVRASAKEWNIDPNKIGIMGFSAGAELASAAAVLYKNFDAKYPMEGTHARPDFAGIIYPGPSPFARNRVAPEIPRNVPPAFIATPGAGDRIHAIWAIEYYVAMLDLGVPNVELHVHGNGRHPGDPLPDGSRMTVDRSRRDAARHLAVPFHRLASRPRFSRQGWRGNEGRARFSDLRNAAAGAPLRRAAALVRRGADATGRSQDQPRQAGSTWRVPEPASQWRPCRR